MNNQLTIDWIRIEGNDSLPVQGKLVLLFIQTDRLQYQIGHWEGERFLNTQGKVFDNNPSHWATLPSPPDIQK